MPRARKLISDASFDADTLQYSGRFSMRCGRPDFRDDPEQIENARIRLATVILKLAKDHQLGPLDSNQIRFSRPRCKRSRKYLGYVSVRGVLLWNPLTMYSPKNSTI